MNSFYDSNSFESTLNFFRDNNLLYTKNKKRIRKNLCTILLRKLIDKISFLYREGLDEETILEILITKENLPDFVDIQHFRRFIKKYHDEIINYKKTVSYSVNKRDDNYVNIDFPDSSNNVVNTNNSEPKTFLDEIDLEYEKRKEEQDLYLAKLSNENGKEVEIFIKSEDYQFIHIPEHLYILNESDPKYPKSYPKRYKTRIHPEGDVPWQQSLPVLISEDNELYELYSQLPITTAYSPFSSKALIDYQANVVPIELYLNRLKKSFDENKKIIHGRKIQV